MQCPPTGHTAAKTGVLQFGTHHKRYTASNLSVLLPQQLLFTPSTLRVPPTARNEQKDLHGRGEREWKNAHKQHRKKI
jgi:hypothetical protein